MRKLTPAQQVLAQLFLFILAMFAILPLMNMYRIAFDGSIFLAPTDFRLWPKEFSLKTIIAVWQHPSQDLTMWELMKNSLYVAGGSAALSGILGLNMAFAFARLRFSGKQAGLFGLLMGALLPPVALMTPLYILLTLLGQRTTLFGLMLVYTAFAMPFCIWNMRSSFLAVPKEIEEAAFLDGANLVKTFLWIDLPLALPSITVAMLVAFIGGYTEFALGWLFVSSSENVTLAMALSGMVNYSGAIWGSLSALTLMTLAPVALIFILLQRYLIKGLLMGALND